MQYPGRVIRQGESDAKIIRHLRRALNDRLALMGIRDLALPVTHPTFDLQLVQAVKMFQARSVDRLGMPLVVDGKVGALTWAALFGPNSVPSSTTAPDVLLVKAIEVAAAEEAIGVREDPVGSNRGPRVDEYQIRCGLPSSGYPWCACFVYWCFDQSAQALGISNPVVRTAGCQDHWARAAKIGAGRIAANLAVNNPGLVQPGMIFIMAFGKKSGHTGIVESVNGGLITTIEGNSNAGGEREGIGVFRLTRKINSVNTGFISYAGL